VISGATSNFYCAGFPPCETSVLDAGLEGAALPLDFLLFDALLSMAINSESISSLAPMV